MVSDSDIHAEKPRAHTRIGGHDHRIVRLRIATTNIPFQQRGDIVLNYVLYIRLTHNTENPYLVFAVAGGGELRRHVGKIQAWGFAARNFLNDFVWFSL